MFFGGIATDGVSGHRTRRSSESGPRGQHGTPGGTGDRAIEANGPTRETARTEPGVRGGRDEKARAGDAGHERAKEFGHCAETRVIHDTGR